MPNLKEVRNRITSVGSTKQITSAMKVVSAAKLRRAQDAIIKMRPYAEKLQEVLSNVSSSLDSSDGVYSQTRQLKKVLLVAITSNRGLAGAFNTNVIKRCNALIEEHKSSQVTILPVGKKVLDFYKRREAELLKGYDNGECNSLFDGLNFADAAPVAQAVMDLFASEKFDKVILVYNQFKNASVQLTLAEQLLPVVPKEEEKAKASSVDYIFEPNKEEIVHDLIPLSLKTQFYKALLDSHAAEHGARMTAMHKATDNANELLKELKLTYNKARQAAITNEILEIVGGAEALNN